MDDEFSTSMAVPLDSDGFLRRECPTCEREFKWFAREDEESDLDEGDEESVPDGGYYCPYCAIQASPDAWFTQAQLEQAQAVIAREFVGPELQKLKREAKRSSGGLVDISVDFDPPEAPESLTETDDMRRVDFACHPEATTKVADDWDGAVHCRLCGTPAEASTTA